MSDKMFCGHCLGSECTHALWERCPFDTSDSPIPDPPVHPSGWREAAELATIFLLVFGGIFL